MVYVSEDSSPLKEILYFVAGSGTVLGTLFGIGWLNAHDVNPGFLDSTGGVLIATIIGMHIVIAAIYVVDRHTGLLGIGE